MRTWLVSFTIALCTAVLCAGSLRAQATTANKAAAEALFDRGLGLLREGKVAEACSALEESQSIEAGIGTMLYLADCYERLRRTASAWALFREASSQAEAGGQSERAEAGRKRAEKLTPLLSTLAVDAPNAPSDAALSVLRSGAPVPATLFGVPVPVDPGEHTIEARAPGYAPFRASLSVSAQGAFRFTVPALAKLPPEPVATGPASGATWDEDPVKRRKLRLAALGVGAAGAVGILLGGVFGVRAIVKNGQANDQCSDGACASPSALTGAERASDSANTAARASNALWITGAVVGAGALGLYFLAPRLSREERPATVTAMSLRLAPRGPGAALELGGAF